MVNCLFLAFFFPPRHFHSHVKFSSAGTRCISFPLQLTVMTVKQAEWDSLLSIPRITPLHEGFGSSPVSSPSQCFQAGYVWENQLASDTWQIFAYVFYKKLLPLTKLNVSQQLYQKIIFPKDFLWTKKADLLVKPRKMQHCLQSSMMPVVLSIHKCACLLQTNLKKKTLLGWLQLHTRWYDSDIVFHADFCTK